MVSLINSVKAAHTRHQKRHTPTGLQFALSDTVELLNQSVWDGLTRTQSVFMQRPFLQLMEASGPDNVQMRYALITEGGAPVAAVVAQSVFVDGPRLIKGRSSNAVSAAFRKAIHGPLAQWQERLLVCGNLITFGQHAVATAPQGTRPVWPAVAEAIYRIRRADGLSGESDFIMVKDLDPHSAGGAKELRTFSFREVETDPNMVLAIRPSWKTYDDYLESLNTKYRKVARGLQKDVEKAGCTVENLTVTDAASEEMHNLYMQVHEKAAIRLFTLRPDFQARMAETFGKDFRCTAVRRDGRIVAFVTTVKDGDTAVGFHVGFDRELNEEAPLYFRMLQAAVENAILLGCKRLSLGRTALEPKAKLGARPQPMSVWVRHRVPAMNLMVRALLGTLEFDDAPERNVFKT